MNPIRARCYWKRYTMTVVGSSHGKLQCIETLCLGGYGLVVCIMRYSDSNILEAQPQLHILRISEFGCSWNKNVTGHLETVIFIYEKACEFPALSILNNKNRKTRPPNVGILLAIKCLLIMFSPTYFLHTSFTFPCPFTFNHHPQNLTSFSGPGAECHSFER